MSGRATWLLCLLLAPALGFAQHSMSEMMQMDDEAHVGKVLIDQLEWREPSSAAWQAQAWYGGDYDKLWVKTEGTRVHGATEDARIEVLWDRIVSPWWSLQAGVREDLGEGPSRTWAAVGIQGLAPQFVDVEAALYVGDGGRAAARVKVEYSLLLTQRLILQPEAEVNLYTRADPERGVRSGLSEIEAGLRLRYEIRRQFAPYAGVVWNHRLGISDTEVVAGLRIWF